MKQITHLYSLEKRLILLRHCFLLTICWIGSAFLGTMLILSCGTGGSGTNKKEPVPRSGKDIKFSPLSYYDNKPALSADGKKVVFISGRNASNDDSSLSNLKAFRVDLDTLDNETDEEKRKPKQVSPSDEASGYSSETYTNISPDGNWVVFEASNGSVNRIYLLDYEGVKSPALLFEDTFSEIFFSFSNDSKLFAFSVKKASCSCTQIFSGEMPDLANPTFSQDSLITVSSDDDHEEKPLWSSDSTKEDYLLLSTYRNQETSISQFFKREFKSFSDLSSTSKEPLFEGDYLQKNELLFVGSSQFIAARKTSPYGSLLTVAKEEKNKIAVKSEPVLIPLAAPDQLVTIDPGSIRGFDVSSVSGNFENSITSLTSKQIIECGDSRSFISVMTVGKNGLSSLEDFVPRQDNDTKEWDWTINDPCLTTFTDQEGTEKELLPDYTVNHAVLNSLGTTDLLSLVYVSSFSGDTEVRLLRLNSSDSSQSKIYEISNNPMP